MAACSNLSSSNRAHRLLYNRKEAKDKKGDEKMKRAGIYIMVVLIFLVFLVPSISKANVDSIVEANNKFAFDLYLNLSKETKTENIFFSPFSISTALAMTYEGARGKTAEEMEKVLYFPKDNQTRRNGFLELITEINKENKKYQLHTANALWVEKTYNLLKEYLEIIDRYYKGKATKVGFINPYEREQSRLMINKWVEDKTNGKIKDLIKPNMLSGGASLVLTNAIYFKGNWQVKFDKSATKEEDFNITPKEKIKVQMMRITGKNPPKFNYAETEDLQVLEMPYEGDELSMLILLPKKSINDVEETITYQKIKELKGKLEKVPVEVYIPKFKFESGVILNELLENMGMSTAFIDLLADFSGINGYKDLYIDKAIHKAFIDVNEEGTEAAAATAIIMGRKSLSFTKPVIFRADRPFMFIIQHNKTGAILFIGRVYKPSY
ncbi:MAG: serpin family protein [Caldimicrobium sp.]